MEELTRLCGELHDLTAALQTALLAEDVPTFARIVQGRTPLLERCITLWEAATPSERAPLEAQLREVIEANALIVQTGEEWLRATRRKLLHLHRGRQVQRTYSAPFVRLPPAKISI